MKGTLVLCSLVLWFGVEAYGQNTANPVESQRALVNQYCAGCHNNNVKSGGFSWTDVDLTHLEKSPDRVEKVIRSADRVMMRAAGAKRLDARA
jgi:cytochrome c551/c552